MKNIKGSTIARLAALIVAVINQCLTIFGKGVLPFTENMTYQVVSVIFTVITMLINAWYNNDITKLAVLTGKIFDALKDKKITEEELEDALKALDNPEESEEMKHNSAVIFVNKIIDKIKNKKNNKKE